MAVLFARRDSIYKTLPGTDVWDEDRDALKWPGSREQGAGSREQGAGIPIIAHPPCRLWGRLSQFAKCEFPIREKDMAIWAIRKIRENGGVLEHPIHSRLFSVSAIPDMPAPGNRDVWGGYQVSLAQWWFGHRAEKWTKLYICGVEPSDLPVIPLRLGDAPCTVASMIKKWHNNPAWRPEITKSEREHTPIAFAEWLLETARRTKPPL